MIQICDFVLSRFALHHSGFLFEVADVSVEVTVLLSGVLVTLSFLLGVTGVSVGLLGL